MLNIYFLTFSIMIIVSTLISVSSYSWMGMWLGLEINLLAIIPLMNQNKNIMSTESSLKYFMIQASASLILMMSVILMMMFSKTFNNLIFNPFLMMILNSSLLTKMGAAPFHFWFPEVMEGLNWMNSIIILTWQKITPMVLLTYNINYPMFFTLIIIFSMLISGIMGINQVSMRKIMAYSSINHMGWMIASMFFIQSTWTIYFTIYSIMTINICWIFKSLNIFFIKQFYSSMNNCSKTKLFFSLNFLSLGGLPPFIGFLPKWLVIQSLIDNKMITLSVIMVISTLITLYFYIRISFTSLLMKSTELNWLTNWNTHQNNFLIMLSNFCNIFGLFICSSLMN